MESSDCEEQGARVWGLDVREKPADVRASRVRASTGSVHSAPRHTGREAVATALPVGVKTDKVTIKLPAQMIITVSKPAKHPSNHTKIEWLT